MKSDSGKTSAEIRVAAGLAFLEQAQRPSGEIPVCKSNDPQMRHRLELDPSVFPTALAVHCLSFVGPAARPIIDRAVTFLTREMDAHGLWRHWTREHPFHAQLPPDLDDTSCATRALVAAGASPPENRSIMLANRTRQGLFLTWVIPRLHRAPLAVTLRQLRHPAALFLFFRRTSARPSDVDAVVNANVLHCLREWDGSKSVIDWLMKGLREGGETQCDKWYDNPIVVRYFLSRALAGVAPEARDIMVNRSCDAKPANALEAAMVMSTLLDWEAGVPAQVVEELVQAQAASGAWPAAAMYHGGRRRLRTGRFAEPHPDTPRWGSEALTTAFAIEALARHSSAAGS